MRVFVEHRTEYVYERPFEHMVQALRLTPPPGPGQRILDWTIACPGIEGAVSYVDGFGNLVHLVTPPGPVSRSMIVARGTVETTDAAGIAGFTGEAAPPGVPLSDSICGLGKARAVSTAERAASTSLAAAQVPTASRPSMP